MNLLYLGYYVTSVFMQKNKWSLNKNIWEKKGASQFPKYCQNHDRHRVEQVPFP